MRGGAWMADGTEMESLIRMYYNGILEGLYRYAWWRDGVQYVGSCGERLSHARDRVMAERGRALEEVRKGGDDGQS